MSRLEKAADVLAAAARWKDRCFVWGESLFGADSLWTRENLEELHELIAQENALSGGSFFERLEVQLRAAAPAIAQLCAEVLWVFYLLMNKAKLDSKRDRIRMVWEWSDTPLATDHLALGPVLGKGFINPGTRYMVSMQLEISYLLSIVADWQSLAAIDREELIKDAWAFADWIDRHEGSKSHQLRHALVFMLFPDEFEPIMSSSNKLEYIREYWIGEGSREESNQWSQVRKDRELLAIRNELERLYGDQFEFWQIHDGYYRTWVRNRFGDVDFWVLSAGQNARFWDRFSQGGIAAMQEPSVGDLRRFESQDDIKQALVEQGAGPNPVNHALAGWQFSEEINLGDVLIAFHGRPPRLLGWGRVTGDYRYDSTGTELRHSRSVKWHECHPVQLVKERGIATKALTKATDWFSWVPHAFCRMDIPIGPEPRHDLFLSKEQFDRIVASLKLRQNVMLQGPPGVGKTFIAKRIAWHLAGFTDPDLVGMVQFHQSYAYEDFVQGWRPTEEGGFKLRDGVFLQFCKKARQRPGVPHTFIIDEINRGNLSRIFGELLMLIESDKRGDEHAIALTYGADGELFSVPPNVHILGLMNTADRSLAIVDYALRRRFAFETLMPEFSSDKFKTFLLDHQAEQKLVDTIVRNLSAVNEKIGRDDDLGSGFEIGHSYFVPDNSTRLSESWYLSIVDTQIAPLLREYWFDRPDRAAKAIEGLREI